MKTILMPLSVIALGAFADPPLPPPVPGLVLVQPATNVVPINLVVPPLPTKRPARTPAFTVVCPHCNVKQVHVRALAVETNGWHAAPERGGNVCERTIHLVCHNADCQQQYTARNEKLVPDVIAIEEAE